MRSSSLGLKTPRARCRIPEGRPGSSRRRWLISHKVINVQLLVMVWGLDPSSATDAPQGLLKGDCCTSGQHLQRRVALVNSTEEAIGH
jgi:hypothetical protein